MFSMSEKDKNEIMLVQRCLQFLTQNLFAFIICFAIVAINLIILRIFLLLEYKNYGIHILDVTTLYNLLQMNFWEHVKHFFQFIQFVFISSLITITLRIQLIHYMIKKLENSQKKYPLFHIPPYSVMQEIIRITTLHTIHIFKKSINFFSFVDRANELQAIIIGNPQESNPSVFTNATFLAFPLITVKNISLKKSFQKSKALLQKKFGKEILLSYSLIQFKLKIYLSIFIIIGVIVHFLLNFYLFFTIMICITAILCVASFFENVTLVLKAALYNCATDKPFEPFTKEEIKRIFY